MAPTTADTTEHYVSAPYDWSDGVEVIEVSYAQPKFTEIQKSELGEREYYGYIIELYYRDDLQEVLAEPLDLDVEALGTLESGDSAALYRFEANAGDKLGLNINNLTSAFVDVWKRSR